MHLIEQIISAIAPHHCIECGAEGKSLCENCTINTFDELPPTCAFCENLTVDGRVCLECRRQTVLQRAWWLAEYETITEQLLHNLKFGRQKAIAEELALQLHQLLPLLPANTVVTWLPTAPQRVRQRGYDQAQLLAKHFATQRKLQCKRLLYRTHNLHQIGADRSTRIRQAQTAYVLAPISLPLSTPILFIDDVTTTGASLQAAAQMLFQTGFTDLGAAVIAKRPFKK